MADPTSSQPIAKEREIRERIYTLSIENTADFFEKEEFSEAIHFGKQALQQCHKLGKKEQVQNLHKMLYFSYLSHGRNLHAEGGHSEEALENAKLALEHSKEIDEIDRMSISESLALIFLELQDFGEALIHGEEWLSHFKENDDTNEKHEAQWIMTSAYHGRALNFLINKQFKEASDDGEQALVYNRDDGIAIEIRWLLVRAYFSQEDFKNALEQFDREPNMLSPKLEVEDYIKAVKIHREMRRYDKAIFYFKEAKKDANRQLKKKLNKWIQDVNQLIEEAIEEANKSIQEDIPPMIKDIGEIDNEKHGNKKEIEEEQTFCHTEENIEKEAFGDEGEPHIEDITKEQCEVLDAEPFFKKENGTFHYWFDRSSHISDECRVYKGYLKWKVPTNPDELKEKKIFCSVLEVKDENTASHQQYMSYILGEAAVKVHNVDGCLVVLDKITSYFIDWYTAMYQSYEGDRNRKNDWWNHIEYNLRRLFRGVIKAISKLPLHHSHENLTSGIAVLDGESKLFNMKTPGIEGYNKDAHCLFYMISNIVKGVHPNKFFDGLDDGDYTKKIGKLHCSKEFSIFLKCLEAGKDRVVDIYHPFFWSEYQQIYFLERVYNLLWKDFKMEEDSAHWNVVLKLERCFSSQWNWVDDIPSEGAFSRVFYYENGPGWEIKHIPKVYAIAFWRHCKTHYNDRLAVGEKRKTVEEIHIELNKRFNILGRVFEAVCTFTENFYETIENSEVHEKLVTLKNMPAM